MVYISENSAASVAKGIFLDSRFRGNDREGAGMTEKERREREGYTCI